MSAVERLDDAERLLTAMRAGRSPALTAADVGLLCGSDSARKTGRSQWTVNQWRHGKLPAPINPNSGRKRWAPQAILDVLDGNWTPGEPEANGLRVVS